MGCFFFICACLQSFVLYAHVLRHSKRRKKFIAYLENKTKCSVLYLGWPPPPPPPSHHVHCVHVCVYDGTWRVLCAAAVHYSPLAHYFYCITNDMCVRILVFGIPECTHTHSTRRRLNASLRREATEPAKSLRFHVAQTFAYKFFFDELKRIAPYEHEFFYSKWSQWNLRKKKSKQMMKSKTTHNQSLDREHTHMCVVCEAHARAHSHSLAMSDVVQ